MRELEERAFASGATAETLMNEAGRQIAEAVQQFFPTPGACSVAVGKGHNGGDALVAARHLAESGWTLSLHEVFPRDTLAPLTARKLEELVALASFGLRVEGSNDVAPKVILDGLLGIGANVSGGLREPIRNATAEINRQRRETGANVFALDIPTGLDGDTGAAAPDTVEADITLAIGFAKQGLVADGAIDFVGRLAVLPLPELTEAAGKDAGKTVVTTPTTLKARLPRRRFSTHKGDCGRVGIIAGSRGLTGAAVMSANAAVRAGAGLVSLFVTPDAYPVIATAVMPEVMTTAVESYRDVLDRSFDALAIGPGLGPNARHQDAEDLLAVIAGFPGPMVVDADALNLLAASSGNLETLDRCAGPRLLTPHPGEMLRLFPEAKALSRQETACQFLARFAKNRLPLTLLLKGSRTLVAHAAGENLHIAYNTTGSPGMATGGMGDVLTGTCAALAGQGLPLADAAHLGAWVCGRAAEIAVFHGWQSQESLCATDLLEFFGGAFNELHGPAPVY